MSGLILQFLNKEKKSSRNWHGELLFALKKTHTHFTWYGKLTFFLLLPTFLTSAVISRFIGNTRWLFHISKHHPKYNNQKESEKINQCPQTTNRFWQVQFFHKSYSSLGILLSCIHNALDSDASMVSARWQPRWEDIALFHPACFVPLMPLVSLAVVSEVHFILGILCSCYPN